VPNVVFVVRNTPVGWVVENHMRYGPYFSKGRAVDLAEGMAEVLRHHGQSATVVIEDAPPAVHA